MLRRRIWGYNRVLSMPTAIQKKQKFLDIGLNFADQNSNEGHDMLKMINSYYQEEEFSDTNKYYCENCKFHSALAIKKSKPIVLPEYLIVTLNRFLFDQQAQKTVENMLSCQHLRILWFQRYFWASNEIRRDCISNVCSCSACGKFSWTRSLLHVR